MEITHVPTHELIGDRAAAESDKIVAGKLLLRCTGKAERATLFARIAGNRRVIAAINAELERRGEGDDATEY